MYREVFIVVVVALLNNLIKIYISDIFIKQFVA